ncbi:MAG: hypothetical protein QOE41_2002 [Mycobacterium sp.]|jgi:hypothetical protein|nr:hypothetical protein [Mycobacterium sp.]MDT5132691.1 hypothetical protein [Mycobacterium sp.]
MNKPYAGKLVVVGAAAAAAGVAALTLSSTGVAGASPDQSGKTFSEAQATLKMLGYTPVTRVTVGDKTAQGDCTVVRQQDLGAPATAGWLTPQTGAGGIFFGGDQPTLYPIQLPQIPTPGQVLLTLACYHGGGVAAGQATGSGDINSKPPSH